MSRTWLFVPGHRCERFDKALAAGADVVIVDLEDAVAAADKPAARVAVAEWLQRLHRETPTDSHPGITHPQPDGAAPTVPRRSRVALRLNAADSPWFADDLRLLAAPALQAVVLPKAESPAVLEDLAARWPDLALVPLVESGAGMAAARALATAPGVERLAFGHLDFQADLGMRDAAEDDLLPWRCELVLASRLAGIAAPLDGVSVALDDADRLAQDVARARRLGFGGKLCIHPRQVAAVRAGFAPSAQEQAWALRVLQAADASAGAAVAVDGQMVDRPVFLRAQAILADAAG